MSDKALVIKCEKCGNLEVLPIGVDEKFVEINYACTNCLWTAYTYIEDVDGLTSEEFMVLMENIEDGDVCGGLFGYGICKVGLDKNNVLFSEGIDPEDFFMSDKNYHTLMNAKDGETIPWEEPAKMPWVLYKSGYKCLLSYIERKDMEYKMRKAFKNTKFIAPIKYMRISEDDYCKLEEFLNDTKPE